MLNVVEFLFSNKTVNCLKSTQVNIEYSFVGSDYIFISDADLPTQFIMGAKESTKRDPTKRGGGIKEPFPVKLHCLLEEHLHDDVISWQPHGLCFLVHKRDEFVQEVMPKYFNQSKFSSFLRQLNLYGFTRLLAPGPDKGAYYHRRFLRGGGQLCTQMIRIRVKGAEQAKISISGQRSQQAAYASELNFSNMAPLPTLFGGGQGRIPATRTTSSVHDANNIGIVTSRNAMEAHDDVEDARRSKFDTSAFQRAFENEKRKKELLAQIIQDKDTRATLSALLAQGDCYDDITTDCKKSECEPIHPHGLDCELANVFHTFD